LSGGHRGHAQAGCAALSLGSTGGRRGWEGSSAGPSRERGRPRSRGPVQPTLRQDWRWSCLRDLEPCGSLGLLPRVTALTSNERGAHRRLAYPVKLWYTVVRAQDWYRPCITLHSQRGKTPAVRGRRPGSPQGQGHWRWQDSTDAIRDRPIRPLIQTSIAQKNPIRPR
jgi:hypothetical protein